MSSLKINSLFLQGKVLYEDLNGITGTNKIILNDNILDYKRLKLSFDGCIDSGNKYFYGNICEIDLTGNLTNFIIQGQTSFSIWASFSLKDNMLTITRNRKVNIDGTMVEGNYIFITKVVGYK